jgi:hypothetical protein
MEKRRMIAVATFVLAAAVWPINAGAASTVVAGRFTVNRSIAQSSSPGHLYVLDDRQKAVYRYPLAQDGLPATQFDGVLYPQVASAVYGLAVDKVGHVFVADPDQGIIAEFAAGATGHQQPISILNVGAVSADRLKIDDAQRLYVHYGVNQDIAIFAKGAHGNDPPISVITPQGDPTDYVVARNGALYVLNDTRPVAVYNSPLRNPSQPDRLIWPDGNFYLFGTTLALDEATERLYIQFGPDGDYWDKVDYDVRPPAPTGAPSVQKPWIFTGDCGSKNFVNVGGTVIIKNYLIVSCLNNADVLVYRTGQFGRQRAPVETVGLGTLSSPWEMAVGP